MTFPRLCCMRASNDFSGYGFSLVATKNETGQFIDEVKTGSPACRAGLKDGDMLIEVNGENILSFSHREVVGLIRGNQSEVRLLVLDPATRAHYETNSTIVHGQMAEVKKICSWEFGNELASQSTEKPHEHLDSASTLDELAEPVSSTAAPEEKTAPRTSGDGVEKVVVGGATVETPAATAKAAVVDPRPSPPPPVEGAASTVQPHPAAQQQRGGDHLSSPLAQKKLSFVRGTPSRRAQMGSNTTFGARAKFFDDL